MRKISITSEEKITMVILSEPEIQEKTKLLYKNAEELFYNRYNEIIDYLGLQPVNEFSHESILKYFDPAFLYEMLQIAVEKAITTENKYDLKENIIECLTEENLNKAIMGEPMIEAFKDAINSIPAEDAYEHAHRGCLIFNLETMNNEENPFDASFLSKEKCTVKRDDEKAKEFYADWPNVLSPQWKDGKYLGCKKFVEGEESNDSKEELKGFNEYLKDDIDE